MIEAIAPAQLPLAPRPLPTELVSSWLLRVAGANCVSLDELLHGFHSSYPTVPYPESLDLGLQPSFLQAIARFCRVPIATIQALDLERRLPHLQKALLLRFPFCPRRCSRLQAWRLGYAFCPLCIAQQPVVHIRWDWCFACIVRCAIHRTSSLHFGCPGCGEADPLSLGSPLITASELACQSCGHHLGTRIDPPDDPQSEQGIQKVEEAYRAALLGTSPHPALLGKITDRAFRRFVDDMLELLVYYSRPGARMQRLIDHGTTLLPRQHLLALIAGLISNAAPSCDAQQRRFRYSRSLKLWTAVLVLIPDSEGERLERASQMWPMPLRRRFESALRHQTRKRWPHTAFQGSGFRPGFEYSGFLSVRDLGTGNAAANSKSGI